MHTSSLRPATVADAETVFKWRNDPWIVSLSSLKKTVSWEEHRKWYKRMLTSPDMRTFIIEIDEVPAGIVRFSKDSGNEWDISTYLLKPYTGMGAGVAAIRQGCSNLLAEFPSAVIIARTLKNNSPSHSAFLKAGFSEAPGNDAQHRIFRYGTS